MLNIRIVLLLSILFLTTKLNAQIAFNTNSTFSYLKGKDASTLASDWMTGKFNNNLSLTLFLSSDRL